MGFNEIKTIKKEISIFTEILNHAIVDDITIEEIKDLLIKILVNL